MAVGLGNDSNFNEIVSTNKKVVVKFYADWCGGCKLLAPRFNQLSDENKFSEITFVDVNAEANPSARRMVGVSNLPFFAIFKDGKLVDTLASSKEDNVIQLLERLK